MSQKLATLTSGVYNLPMRHNGFGDVFHFVLELNQHVNSGFGSDGNAHLNLSLPNASELAALAQAKTQITAELAKLNRLPIGVVADSNKAERAGSAMVIPEAGN